MSPWQPSLSPLGLNLQHCLRSPALSLHRSKRFNILDENSPARALWISDVLLTSSLPAPPCWPSPFRPSSRKKSHQSRSWSGSQGRFRVEVAVSRRRSSTVACRRPGAPAAAQVHLYGARAWQEEKRSSERRWEQNRGRSTSPGCSCSSDRRWARPRGAPSFRHNSTTKRAATFKLGQRLVYMLALLVWWSEIFMLLRHCKLAFKVTQNFKRSYLKMMSGDECNNTTNRNLLLLLFVLGMVEFCGWSGSWHHHWLQHCELWLAVSSEPCCGAKGCPLSVPWKIENGENDDERLNVSISSIRQEGEQSH